MHPSTQKKLIETSVRNRVDDKFVPIIIFCRKEDRKERREKGEQIEEEG